VNSSLAAHYNVPWYIDFLLYDIEQHLQLNFKLKLDSVAPAAAEVAAAAAGRAGAFVMLVPLLNKAALNKAALV
jgi:predicted NBD/HSP70 family sugar kinase